MASQSVTLNIPDPLYDHLKQRADQARRSVEEETLEVLATAVPTEEELPADLSEAMESLKALDDGELWGVARSHLSPRSSQEIQTLHRKRDRNGLSDAQSAKLADLLRQYERQVLLRAQAVALLKERGHDVSELVQS